MAPSLPARPNFEHLQKQAKALLREYRAASAEAVARFRAHHPHCGELDAKAAILADAQMVIAREYGFASWAELKAQVAARQGASVSEASVRELQKAAGDGDLARLAELLEANPELLDETGGPGVRTALHHAVFGRSEAGVRWLLERGANPNIRCEGDNAYPLHFACEKQLFPIIRLLVEHGADTVGEGDFHELGVLGWTTAWEGIDGNREIVDYLLAHGARHNIFSAVAVGDVEAIREIVGHLPGELGKRMDVGNRRRMPIHLAVIKRQPEALRLLLELGAKAEALDVSNFTALDQAALLGYGEMVTMLLDRGAKMRLPAAIALGQTAVVKRLLGRDPDALKPGNRWEHLLVRAAEHSPGTVIDALVDSGAAVNLPDDAITAVDLASGYTALHAAAWHGNMSAVAALMRHGADVSAREGKWHGSPAGWANYAGHKEVRDFILTGPVNMMDAAEYGLTQRIEAIVRQDPAALERTLASYGIFPLYAEGWFTPLTFALKQGKAEVVRVLLRLGADARVRSPEGRTLLEMATEGGNGEIVEMVKSAS